jgi:hypothetical protein
MTDIEEQEPYTPVEGEPVYNLVEAAEVIGRTTGSFYAPKNKVRLQELGCKTGGAEGWVIPESALIAMGWLNPDGAPTSRASRRPRKGGVEFATDVSEADVFAMMDASKEDLVREVLRLRDELSTSEGIRTVLEKDIERLQGQVSGFLEKLS